MVSLFLAWAFSAATAPKITFESPGVTVAALCEELSRQAGKHIAAWDEVRSDLIAVRLNAAPLDEVLKQLAFAERARVIDEGDTINVRPDQLARQKLHEEGVARRAKVIKSIQDEMKAEFSPHPFDREQADQLVNSLNDLQKKRKEAPTQRESVDYWLLSEQEGLKTPAGRILVRMFTSIPTEQLAAIPTGASQVWSTYPTAVEQKVPLDEGALLGELNSTSLIWSDLRSHLHFPNPVEGQPTRTDSDPVKVLRLSVSGGNQPILELVGFNARGQVAFEFVVSTWTPKTINASKKHQNIDPQSPDHPELVEMPPTVAREIRLWSAYPREEEMKTYVQDPEFIKRFYNPEKYDPVAETFGNAIVALAKHEDKQLLCPEFDDAPRTIPDSAMTKKGLNLSFFKAALLSEELQSYFQTDFSDTSSWMTLRPSYEEAYTAHAFDRAALGELCRQARDTGNLSIMDVAKYAGSTQEYFGPPAWQMVGFLPTAVPNLTGFSLINEGEWPVKSFLGRLTDDQIAQAQKPEGLNLNACNAYQLEALGRSFRFERFSVQGKSNVWQSFPTDGIPNGLPGDGVLHLSVSHEQAFQVDIGEPGGPFDTRGQYMTEQELVDRLNAKGHGEKYNSYNLLKICPQQSENYHFVFDFPGGVKTEKILSDYRPLGKPVPTIEALPEPYRSSLSDQLRKAAG